MLVSGDVRPSNLSEPSPDTVQSMVRIFHHIGGELIRQFSELPRHLTASMGATLSNIYFATREFTTATRRYTCTLR